RAAQLITTALAAVYNDQIVVPGHWDGNDYALLARAVEHLDVGEYHLDPLKWSWKGHGAQPDGTSKTQQFIIPAVAAYMKAEK
ncbi:uncharacterized protein EDB91DRAFT_1015477, partial [Suillus paluster]|uniref:uncharacterized protein n=1 Tax=Suillus paluster TaxID=48578 RepID=UPI001B86B5D9